MNSINIPVPDGIVDFFEFAIPILAIICVIAFIGEALTSQNTK